MQTLADWLAYLERLHPSTIELGLERVGRVATRLGLARPARQVVTVAGTNGKGTCVAYLDAILREAGYRVGVYTSPHLLSFNERAVVDGQPLDDDCLVRAFERVEAARGEDSLTYFEFTTLAILDEFSRRDLDVALLEVGLGGRLDAVNIVEPDVAVVSSISIDHESWLGSDRESIGAEKAGIFRAGRPAVCGDPQAPASLKRVADAVDAHWLAIGEDFLIASDEGDSWSWRGRQRGSELKLSQLPKPELPLCNAPTALQALACLDLEVPEETIRRGLASARLAGRFQREVYRGVQLVLDVAHNPASAQLLAERLRSEPVAGHTHLLFAALEDKDIPGICLALKDVAKAWFVADLGEDIPRTLRAERLGDILREQGIFMVSVSKNVKQAMGRALSICGPEDRLVVCGSFYTVAAVMEAIERERGRTALAD